MGSTSVFDRSDLLSRAKTKHRRRLWISRLTMGVLFLIFLYGAYDLLEWVIVLPIGSSLGVLYLRNRNREGDSIADLGEEEPPLLLRNVVKSLSKDYEIEKPKVIVTNEGELNEHLYVVREDGVNYLGVSTVHLDLVSEDGLASGLAHEFEHLANRDLYGGRFRTFALEFFISTVTVIASIFAVVVGNKLLFGNSPIQVYWSVSGAGVLLVSSLGFYLSQKWAGRESEWLADIGAIEHIGAKQHVKGLLEQQLIYGIPIVERLRDRFFYLLHTHPPTMSRARFAEQVSEASIDEIIDSIELESLPKKAKKYSEFTPDMDE